MEDKKSDWLKNPKLWIGVGVAVVAIIAVICLLIGFGGCNGSKETAGNGETQVQTQEETGLTGESESVAEMESQIETESETETESEIETPVENETQKETQAPTQKETQKVTEAPTQKETQKVTEAPTQKETETQIQLTEEEKKAKAVVDTIITPSMSDVEKVIAIHNWICVNCKESEKEGAATVDGLLNTKKGNAWGYAKTFAMMAKLAGQGSECVEGICTDLDGTKRNHMWNKVEIDGQWYNIDVANDDGYAGIGFFYTYCLRSDQQYADYYAATTTGIHACPSAYDAVKVAKLGVARGENPNCMVATTQEEIKTCAETLMEKEVEKYYIIYISDSINTDNQWSTWGAVANTFFRPIRNVGAFAPQWGNIVYVAYPIKKADFDNAYVARTADEVKAYAVEQYNKGVASYNIRFEPADGNVDASIKFGGGYAITFYKYYYNGGKLVTVTFKK